MKDVSFSLISVIIKLHHKINYRCFINNHLNYELLAFCCICVYAV